METIPGKWQLVSQLTYNPAAGWEYNLDLGSIVWEFHPDGTLIVSLDGIERIAKTYRFTPSTRRLSIDQRILRLDRDKAHHILHDHEMVIRMRKI